MRGSAVKKARTGMPGKRVQRPLAALGNESESAPDAVNTVKKKSVIAPDLSDAQQPFATELSQSYLFGGDVVTRI